MNDEQPAQPLTDAELESYRQGFSGPYDGHVIRLLAEVDRLRAENAQLRRNAELASDGAPKTTPTSGIVVNFEPGAPMSSTDNFAIGFSAGLRRGRQGR